MSDGQGRSTAMDVAAGTPHRSLRTGASGGSGQMQLTNGAEGGTSGVGVVGSQYGPKATAPCADDQSAVEMSKGGTFHLTGHCVMEEGG